MHFVHFKFDLLFLSQNKKWQTEIYVTYFPIRYQLFILSNHKLLQIKREPEKLNNTVYWS